MFGTYTASKIIFPYLLEFVKKRGCYSELWEGQGEGIFNKFPIKWSFLANAKLGQKYYIIPVSNNFFSKFDSLPGSSIRLEIFINLFRYTLLFLLRMPPIPRMLAIPLPLPRLWITSVFYNISITGMERPFWRQCMYV